MTYTHGWNSPYAGSEDSIHEQCPISILIIASHLVECSTTCGHGNKLQNKLCRNLLLLLRDKEVWKFITAFSHTHTHTHVHTHQHTHTDIIANFNLYSATSNNETFCGTKSCMCVRKKVSKSSRTDGRVVGGGCSTHTVNTCLHQSEWSIVRTVPWIILQ